MELKKTKTERGFDLIEFDDRNGVQCSLQKSSLATEDAIWLGCDDAKPRVMVPGEGWKLVEMPPGYLADTRMHLSRGMVKKLLPHLVKFVLIGRL